MKAFYARFVLVAVAVVALVLVVAKANQERAHHRAGANCARHERIHQIEGQRSRATTTRTSDREQPELSTVTTSLVWPQ
jgi:hypothetical protein